MGKLAITIDGHEVRLDEGHTLLAAARAADVYIPTLCHHDDLPPATEEDACGICLVTVEGMAEPVRACETVAVDGMTVTTTGTALEERRRAVLGRILATHPHVCLTCAEREGCSRDPCSANVPVSERCCEEFGDCELQRLAEHVGVPANLPPYVPQDLPVFANPLFIRDANLCVVCGRCIRACQELRGVGAVAVVESENGGRAYVAPKNGTSAESHCRFCGTCVEVCPTGALSDRDLPSGDRAEALVPCRASCPADVDIPLYVGLMAEGRADEAAAVVRNRVPLPSVLGHVCYRPCEDACRRGKLTDPVAICDLKRVAGEAPAVDPIPAPDTGKRVAIVGGGPAGLSAAFYLRILGHAVVVFEAEEKMGGMLRYGIPTERLPRGALDGDLEMISRLEVELTGGMRLGDGLDRSRLEAEFDAVLLTTGAGVPRTLPVPGADLDGVVMALDFLKGAAEGSLPVEVDGRRVMVVGGDNVAMDAAAIAARHGAETVHVFCLEEREMMPARPEEIAATESAGVQIRPAWGPTEFHSAGGQVAGAQLVRCTSVFDATGAFAPEFDDSQMGRIPAEVVILAVGQEVDPGLTDLLADLPIPVHRAGDVVTGPTNVTEAVAAGRRAAISVDEILGGTGKPAEYVPEVFPSGRLGEVEGFAELPRAKLPLTPQTAEAEANRCLRCALRLDLVRRVRPITESL